MLRNAGFDYDPGDHLVTCDQGHTHWGRNGAAGMLLRHQDPHTGIARYFLQQRGPDVQHPGTWSTPGGAIEDGETPHAAAMREASEELGDFPAYNLNHIHTLDHGGWAYHTVTADVPHPFYPHGQNWDPNETSDAGWFTPHEIDELPLHPGFREGWDQYKPNQRPDPHREIWSRLGSPGFAHSLNWEPGSHGRGFVFPPGEQVPPGVHTWSVDMASETPTHADYLDHLGYENAYDLQYDAAHPFLIHPDGKAEFYQYHPNPAAQVEMADPRLSVHREDSLYGHGWNLARCATNDAPNPDEEGWDFGTPKQGKLAWVTRPWVPGYAGKGLVTPTGNVIHWRVDQADRPDHMDVMGRLPYPAEAEYRAGMNIDADGGVNIFGPHRPTLMGGPLTKQILDAHPAFNENWNEDRYWDCDRYDDDNDFHESNSRLSTPLDRTDAADTLWYNPGGHAWKDPHTRQWHQDWGRGILTPDQQMYTWPSDEMTHHERIISLGLENRERGENTPVQFKIDPEGQIHTTDPGYWYNKAHPWIENQLTQYDPRLKATPVDPEIYGRDWNPETGEWAGRRSAASTLAWKPGQHGKGIVTPTGAVYKWSVWPDRDGDPSHSQVVSRMGYDRVPEMAAQLHYFGITPTGGLRYVVDDSGENSPPEVIQHVMNSLQPATEKMSWWRWVNPERLPNPVEQQQGPTDETHPLAGGPNWYWVDEDNDLMWQRPVAEPTQWSHAAGQFVPELPEQDGSTDPQEVANPEDHWPDWGERPPDLPSGTHTDYDWALTRV